MGTKLFSWWQKLRKETILYLERGRGMTDLVSFNIKGRSLKIYLLEIGFLNDSFAYRAAYLSYRLALRAMRAYKAFDGKHKLTKPWKFYHRWGSCVEYNSKCFVEGSSEHNIDDAVWKIWAEITTIEVEGGEGDGGNRCIS